MAIAPERREGVVEGDFFARADEVSLRLKEGASTRDAERKLPYAEMELLRSSGIPTARVPTSYGGPGVGFGDLAQLMARVAAGDPNAAQNIQPHFVMLDLLHLKGTEAQKKACFSQVMNGAMFTNAFAERGKKRPQDMDTVLTSCGESYLLNGRKFYSTGSLFCDLMHTIARTDEGVLTIVMFPTDREGVTVVDDWDGMGQRTTASGTTEFKDVVVAPEEIIPLPTWGEERMFVFSGAQLVHAAIDVGIGAAAWEDAMDYCRTRARPVPDSGLERATDDPYMIYSIGEMGVHLHAAEAMLQRAGDILDHASEAQLSGRFSSAELERVLIEASIAVAEAKAVANSTSLRLCEQMYAVGGAGMTMRRFNYDRHWRNARTHTLHDPVAYKFKAIGDYYLNEKPPIITTKL